MSLKKFLYFLTEKDGRARQVLNGVVTSLNNKRPLPQAPDGNQEISIGWERSPLYWSNMRNFSLPLGFVMDGAKIGQNDAYKFNVDRELYLLIKKLTYEYTDTTFKEYYKQFYKGQLDFSTFEDDKGTGRVSFSIMQGGIQRKFKAAETTDFEIPFDQDSVSVRMDGMYITGKFRWTIPASGGFGTYFLGTYQLPNDNPIPGLAWFDVFEETTLLATAGNEAATQYFGQATQNVDDVHLQMAFTNINQGAANPTSPTLELQIWNSETGAHRTTIDLAPGSYTPGQTLLVDETFNLLKGDKLFLKKIFRFGESSMTITAKSKPPESVVPAFTIYQLGRKLTEKITGNADDFVSPFLESKNILINSGDGLRSITGAAVKTNWQNYWKAVDAYTFACLDFSETTVRIRERALAFDYSVIHPLGAIKDLKVTPATELMATSIKVGHKEQKVDDTNGKVDFNGFLTFNAPIKAIPAKELNIQTNYKAGPIEIEQIRANYEGKTTTDKESDNETFVLAAVPDADLNIFTVDSLFQADGTPFAPGLPLITIGTNDTKIRAGMILRISGTATSNDKDVVVVTAGSLGGGQLIQTAESLVDFSGPATFEIVAGGYYELDRSIPVDQLSDPDADQAVKDSVFNVPLSPKRILMLHRSWLATIFSGYGGQKLTYANVSRNKELIADGLVEKADVPINDLGDPLALPWWFEFDTISPADLPAIHDNDPNPAFSFLWDNVEYVGFCWSDGFAANTMEEQTFKLLAAPINNMLNLINQI